MQHDFKIYSATGNIIGVAYYPELFDIQAFVHDARERRLLKSRAVKNRCDSVMVVMRTHGNPALHTIVFEPNAGEDGGFSTMCGNGVRAVASYAENYLGMNKWPLLLGTRSGTLSIEKTGDPTYRVCMGKSVCESSALHAYVNADYFPNYTRLIDAPIPPQLLWTIGGLPFSSAGAVYSIGFTTSETDSRKQDGEPHLVITLDPARMPTVARLRAIAEEYGPRICGEQEIFPQGMNANFVVPEEKSPASFLICTYERNLGNDPKLSVTQACGTGSTFAGSELLRKLSVPKIVAHCTGGNLTIEQKGEMLFMSGEVHEI